jgi:hypothetical protein
VGNRRCLGISNSLGISGNLGTGSSFAVRSRFAAAAEAAADDAFGTASENHNEPTVDFQLLRNFGCALLHITQLKACSQSDKNAILQEKFIALASVRLYAIRRRRMLSKI